MSVIAHEKEQEYKNLLESQNSAQKPRQLETETPKNNKMKVIVEKALKDEERAKLYHQKLDEQNREDRFKLLESYSR